MKDQMVMLFPGEGNRMDSKELTETHHKEDYATFDMTGEILPSLGARSNHSVNLRRFVISPFDYRYRMWDKFLLVLVFYNVIVSPLEFGFIHDPDTPLSVTDNVLNSFFAVDIVLTFFVAYLDKSTHLLVDNHKKIALKYTKRFFILDVISTIPAEVVRVIFRILFENDDYFGWLSLFRLWRLRRLHLLFQRCMKATNSIYMLILMFLLDFGTVLTVLIFYHIRLEKDRNYNYVKVRFAKLTFVTLFAVHMAGCAYYWIGTHYNASHSWFGLISDKFSEGSLWARYVTSIYWSTTTLTTVGYGDIHAVNPVEMVFCMSYMMFNLALTSYLIGNFTSLAVHATSHTRQFRDSINAATSFAKRNNLPVRLADQMADHLTLKYRTDMEGLHQQETIESLPKAIRASISNHLFHNLVREVYLFDRVSPDFLFQLVSDMKAEYYPPREDVILQNEAPTDLYIIVTGAVEFIMHKGGSELVVGEARSGAVFGEIGVLCYRPQHFTVRTKRLCQLLRLNRNALMSMIQTNDGEGFIMTENLIKHLKEIRKSVPKIEAVLHAAEDMQKRRMDSSVNLCYAATREDDILLKHLLQDGCSPNELDSKGQSALNIAVSGGNEDFVVLLLDSGADPNLKDLEGNVPLWVALRGTNEGVMSILLQCGATLSSGDVGQYAITAVEENRLDLLKEIVKHGGDVTVASSEGNSAIHEAVSEGHTEIVKFLLERGANIDRPNSHGWTARQLADQQGHEEIKALFQDKTVSRCNSISKSMNPNAMYTAKPMRYCSEPAICPLSNTSSSVTDRLQSIQETRSNNNRQRAYRNSVFGFLSGANAGEIDLLTSYLHGGSSNLGTKKRVILSCPEKGEVGSKLVQLPKTIQELLDDGANKFKIAPAKILTKEGAEIEDIDVIRDGDQLLLVSNANKAIYQKTNC